MSGIGYCPRCGKNVLEKDRINWVILIVLLILGIVLGLIYAIYCLSAKERSCRICGYEPLYPPRQGPGYFYPDEWQGL